MANQELKAGLKKALGHGNKELNELIDKEFAVDILSDFKERFDGLIKHNREELEKFPPERQFCEEVIAREDKLRQEISKKKGELKNKINKPIGHVGELIELWESRKPKSQKLATNPKVNNDQQELTDAEHKEKLLETINSNRREFKDLIEDMIGKSQKGDVEKNSLKNIQEILVFVIKEKLLPAKTIQELSNQFLAVKNSAQTQDSKIDVSEIYTSQELNKIIDGIKQNNPGLEKITPELLGRHLDAEKTMKTISYHFQRIENLVLQVVSSEKLTSETIENALSYIEKEDRETENKKALIRALKARMILDPEAFLCLEGRFSIADKLLDSGIDVVGFATNQLDDKELALKYVKIGFNSYLVSPLSLDDQISESSEIDLANHMISRIRVDTTVTKKIREESPILEKKMSDRELEVVDQYVIPYLESRAFGSNDIESQRMLLELGKAYIATQNVKKLEEFFTKYEKNFSELNKDYITNIVGPFAELEDDGDYFNKFNIKCAIPFVNLAKQTKNPEIINLVKTNFEKFAKKEGDVLEGVHRSFKGAFDNKLSELKDTLLDCAIGTKILSNHSASQLKPSPQQEI